MMKAIAKWIFVSFVCVCGPAIANSYTSDMSDTWWNESEAGWGVNVNHQHDAAFLTFFVYGNGGRVAWYTGQTTITGQNTDGSLIFSGDIYEFSGPWFGSTFLPGAVTGRKVGTVTFSAFLDRATLTYTIDGVSVSKVVSRQTFRNNELSGTYMGAIKRIQAACSTTADNGETNANAEISVTNTGNSLTMRIQKSDGLTCSFVGDYAQTGRLGRSQGKYTCTDGAKGSYDAFELDANTQSLSGRFFFHDSACASVAGRFAGMKK